jgi:cytochrome c553
MKRLLIHFALFIVLAGVGGLLFAWSGIYNVAASKPHLAITEWFLHFGLRNSVETHSMGIKAPPLDDPAMIRLGLAYYQGGCAPCHGAPSYAGSPVTDQMLPPPPWMPEAADKWTDEHLFWIVVHGLKYAGMPAWAAEHREDEVWSVVAAIRQLPHLPVEEYRRLALGDAVGSPDITDETAHMILMTGPAGEGLTACARCHGLDGAADGRIPRLAGQKREYLAETLRAYARGTRPSGFMRPVAAELNDEEITELADYYSSREDVPYPPQPEPTDLLALQKGATLAAIGDLTNNVPACTGCHAASGRAEDKAPTYPAIAGQPRIYLEQQLRLWRDGVRGGGLAAPLMTKVAEGLTDEQIAAVALYFSMLRPEVPRTMVGENP